MLHLPDVIIALRGIPVLPWLPEQPLHAALALLVRLVTLKAQVQLRRAPLVRWDTTVLMLGPQHVLPARLGTILTRQAQPVVSLVQLVRGVAQLHRDATAVCLGTEFQQALLLRLVLVRSVPLVLSALRQDLVYARVVRLELQVMLVHLAVTSVVLDLLERRS